MRGICKGGSNKPYLRYFYYHSSIWEETPWDRLLSDTKLMEGVFDTEYFIHGFWNLKPHWRGLGKSHIFFTPQTKSWRLESFYDTEKVSYLIFIQEYYNHYLMINFADSKFLPQTCSQFSKYVFSSQRWMLMIPFLLTFIHWEEKFGR